MFIRFQLLIEMIASDSFTSSLAELRARPFVHVVRHVAVSRCVTASVHASAARSRSL